MKRRIDIRPQTQSDLREIGDYSDAHWGRIQAKLYLDAIADTIDQIAAMPLAGSDQANVSPGLRKWRSGSHNIYYRTRDDAVLIVRIMHERMDVASARATLQGASVEYRPEI
ncbi:type II toxin-antitoxin system RelE/ParE family toxin [Sphingomonas sp.]|uniref:type II toxin-antitoxin system RelE/ParE family toxin n=1 Tax=Sphingomonas sp. TaxID=28214 RepID=UPI002ED9E250